ncbi:hypothetical protein [Sessilibacter sp. MAH2]
MNKLFVSLIFAAASFNAVAGSGNGFHKITSVNLSDTGYLLITFDGRDHTESCTTTSTGNTLIVDRANADYLDRRYTMALSALLAGKEVYAYVNGCLSEFNNATMYGRATKMIIKD